MMHLVLKFQDIMHSAWGCVAFVGAFVAGLFAGQGPVIMVVVIMTIMDAIWGIWVSVKQHRFTRSDLMRLTIDKLLVYFCVLLAVCSIDFIVKDKTGFQMTLTTAVVGSVIILTELWSSCASMLILFPNFLFLRLMQKALTGEIARKMNIKEEDVADILRGIKKDNAENGPCLCPKEDIINKSINELEK
jgi:hypothetical protein